MSVLVCISCSKISQLQSQTVHVFIHSCLTSIHFAILQLKHLLASTVDFRKKYKPINGCLFIDLSNVEGFVL